MITEETVRMVLKVAIECEIDMTLGAVAEQVGSLEPALDWVDIVYDVAHQIDQEARAWSPELPLIDHELIVWGCSIRDLAAFRTANVGAIGGALGAQLRAIYEVAMCDGSTDTVDAMEVAEILRRDLGISQYLGRAKIGEVYGDLKRIA